MGLFGLVVGVVAVAFGCFAVNSRADALRLRSSIPHWKEVSVVESRPYVSTVVKRIDGAYYRANVEYWYRIDGVLYKGSVISFRGVLEFRSFDDATRIAEEWSRSRFAYYDAENPSISALSKDVPDLGDPDGIHWRAWASITFGLVVLGFVSLILFRFIRCNLREKM